MTLPFSFFQFKIAFASVLLIIVSNSTVAQEHDFDSLVEANPNFDQKMQQVLRNMDLFAEETPLKISLQANFSAISAKRFKDEYSPALLRYQVNDTVWINREIKVKPRGNMRLKTCSYPPLKVNFPRKEVYMTQLQNFDKMKMVVSCRKGDAYEQYILSEYYAYKLYNILTPYSLRVRLIEVKYINTGKKKNNEKSGYAFIIEEIEQLAARTNTLPSEKAQIKDKFMNTDMVTNMYLFQYMIGNTDWTVYSRHNMRVVLPRDEINGKPIVVPYDFDYAGIVGASYAIPSDQLEIKSVNERTYRGYCDLNDQLPPSIKLHRSKKEDLISVFETAIVNPVTKKRAIRYLEKYFQIIENDKKIKSLILDRCLTR